MRTLLLATGIFVLAALPLAAQQEGTPPAPKPEYSREKLRSIFLEASKEAEDAHHDPFKTGIPLFSFGVGNSKTTVRFLPFGALMAAWVDTGARCPEDKP